MASMEPSVKVLVVLSMRLIFRDITNEESVYELAACAGYKIGPLKEEGCVPR